MRVAICILIALGGGVASGYWGYGSDPSPVVRRVPVDRNVWAPTVPEPARAGADPFDGVASVDGPYPDLISALASVEPLPPVAGDGVITIRVESPEGEPVSGVTVRVTPNDYPWNRSPDRTPADYVRDLARNARWRHESSRVAVTDAEGIARLTGIGEGEYYVRAELAGHEIRIKGQGRHFRAGESGVYVATPVGEIEVRVVMPDGSKAERASIRAENGRAGRSWNWSLSARRKALAPGRYTLSAESGAWKQLRAKGVSVEVRPGKVPAVATLHLKSTRGIAGRIEPALEAGPNSLDLHLVAASGDGIPSLRDAQRNGRNVSVFSMFGQYKFMDLERGDYHLLLASDDDLAPLAHARVQVADDFVVRNFGVADVASSALLTVEVYAPDGSPAEGVRFDGHHRDDEGRETRSRPFVLVDAPGRYRVQHPWPAGRTDGRGTLTLTHKKFATRFVAYTLPRVDAAVVRYRAMRLVRLQVEGFEGSGYEGEILAFMEQPQDPEAVRSDFRWTGGNYVRDDGSWAWTAEEGEYQIRLYPRAGLWALAHTNVQVGPDGATARMAFPKLHTVRVEVDQPIQRVDVERIKGGRQALAGSVRLDDEMRAFPLRGLPAGTYRIRCDGGPATEFSVPTREPVRCKAR
ncbi:MAG: hypothetical protein AAGD14_08945 [Planctomycetota bacterium]